ncbi:hypothetical protein [Brevundimonas sp. LM2]|nr:hypothetical protein [Brevundimonas sp. LM2]
MTRLHLFANATLDALGRATRLARSWIARKLHGRRRVHPRYID